jgi:hypothetical protein
VRPDAALGEKPPHRPKEIQMTQRYRKVCAECGSDRVLLDAFAEWDEQKQDWTLQNTFDDAYCEGCEESGVDIEDVEIDAEGNPINQEETEDPE